MIKTDSHLHTSFSSDSDSPMEDMILGGIDCGLSSMCFTEHLDFDFPDTEDHFDFLVDYQAYEDEFKRLKDKYEGKIHLYHGIELGVQPHLSEKCNHFYREYGERYDFIIHSTHLIDGMDPYYGAYFAAWDDPKAAIRHYFEIMLENLNIYEHYQTVGHLDYICRYEPKPQTPFNYEEYQDVIDPVLLHIISHNKALEVNTAGWKYGMEDPNPNRQILSRYRELGGDRITIGSDGHKPEHIAYDFGKLTEFLKNLGFSSYLFFKKQEEEKIFL